MHNFGMLQVHSHIKVCNNPELKEGVVQKLRVISNVKSSGHLNVKNMPYSPIF